MSGYGDYGYFGKGQDGYVHYMQSFHDNFGKGGGGGRPSGGGGGNLLKAVFYILVAVILIVILLNWR